MRNNDLVSVALPIISAFAASTTVENKTVKNEKKYYLSRIGKLCSAFFQTVKKRKKCAMERESRSNKGFK